MPSGRSSRARSSQPAQRPSTVTVTRCSRASHSRTSELVVEGLLHAPQVANVAPVDGVGFVAEVVIGQLLQPRQLGVDLGGTRSVGSVGVGVAHRGFRVDRDALIHALFRPEAKLGRATYPLIDFYPV